MQPAERLLTAPATIRKSSREPPRSPRWASVRAAFIARNPRCAACATDVAHREHTLNVHHVVPFHIVVRVGRPDLELDERNLITLCEGGEQHHLVLGHLCDWESYNPRVREDVARPEVRGRSGCEIQRLAWWIAERATRPSDDDVAGEADRTRTRAVLDAMYPPVG